MVKPSVAKALIQARAAIAARWQALLDNKKAEQRAEQRAWRYQ